MTEKEASAGQSAPKAIVPIAITPPPAAQRVARNATFAAEGERRDRYALPSSLRSESPIGYRTRCNMTEAEVTQLMPLLSLARPTRFVDAAPVTEQTLFEESSLGIMSARQSTNYRGHQQTTLGPEASAKVADLMRELQHNDTPILDGASYTHVVFTRPYRTAFTFLLTFVGHKPFANLLTVPLRALEKKLKHTTDIPTIAYLQDLHIGVLADAMERAAVLASCGTRKAQIHQRPFCTSEYRRANAAILRQIEALAGLTPAERRDGWRIALVAQVGEVPEDERLELSPELVQKTGANLVAFRSERIQPGVNQDNKAPAPYKERQDMDVSDKFTEMAGRAAFNAFAHWTQCDREKAKDLLLLERVDVLTDGGKERIRGIRKMLEDITDTVAKRLPLWIDLPTGRTLSRTVRAGKKAFALAGQRIYIGGLSKPATDAANIPWELAIRAVGACSARSALYSELMGVMDIPENCDLLAGICMMAGPVNQNDIGKCFYGYRDLLADAFPNQDTTSLLVWTLKAKTVADPVGNEEQLLNPKRQGKLVDLRPGPHQVVNIEQKGTLKPMRQRDGKTNQERAFHKANNFVTDTEGKEIPGNRGEAWPQAWAEETLW